MIVPPVDGAQLLAELVEQLDAADEYISVVAGPPSDDERDRWVRLADLSADPGVIDAVLAATTSVCGGERDAGAAYLAGWVAEMAVAKAYGAMASTGRTWVLDPAQLWMRRHPEGWFDGLAVGEVAVRVPAADAAAGAVGVIESADAEALERGLADDAVALLTPVFAAIRARAPFGTRGMWGTVADSVVAGAAYDAFRAGRDEHGHIERARRFVDVLASRLAEVGGATVTRPTTLQIECAARPVEVVQKGTCCLWYKVPESSEDGSEVDGSQVEPEPGPHYCLSCPLVDDAVQEPKWRTWLEAEYAHLAPPPQGSPTNS